MLQFMFGLSVPTSKRKSSDKYKIGNKLVNAKKIDPKLDPSIKVK